MEANDKLTETAKRAQGCEDFGGLFGRVNSSVDSTLVLKNVPQVFRVGIWEISDNISSSHLQQKTS